MTRHANNGGGGVMAHSYARMYVRHRATSANQRKIGVEAERQMSLLDEEFIFIHVHSRFRTFRKNTRHTVSHS